MIGSATTVRFPTLVVAALLALVALLLWSDGHGARPAAAYPGLTVGIDMNLSTTSDTNGDGVFETVNLGKFERCRDVSVGQQFEVGLFVLDVQALAAFLADFEYNGSQVKVIGSFTGTTPSNPNGKMFMSAQSSSSVTNTSQNSPNALTGVLLISDTDGRYEAGAFDSGNVNGDSGSGMLVRLKLEALAAGVSTFGIDIDTFLDRGVTLTNASGAHPGDTDADGFFDGPFINSQSTIAVGQVAGNDNDGDLVSNTCDNCPNFANPFQEDTDLDGLGDVCDNDDDGDGVADGPDNCNLVPNPGQGDVDGDGIGDACEDSDGDGILDASDNCPLTSNPSQTNTDGDGQGDACDLDDDGDGVPDLTDNCQLVVNPGQEDSDSNGIGDACQDTDGDGLLDTVDNCPVNYNPSQTDADGDGWGNSCDNCGNDYNPAQDDVDGDGIGDTCDTDNDNDGVPDVSDNCPTNFNPSQSDIDGDGPGDPCDNDADADGYLKTTEQMGGSSDTSAASTPEVCDGNDDDGDTVIDEGWDYNANGTPDCSDATLDTDGDTQANNVDADDDGDRSTDQQENWMATDSLTDCGNGSGFPDWGSDLDGSGTVNIADLIPFKPAFGTALGQPNFVRRYDMDASAGVNIADLIPFKPNFGLSCTP